jgi:hypothetical protein
MLKYCLHVCDLNRFVVESLDFSVLRLGFRIVRTSCRDIVNDCFRHMGFALPSKLLQTRSQQFNVKLATVDNFFVRSASLL